MFPFTSEEKTRFSFFIEKLESSQSFTNLLSSACRRGLLDFIVWYYENGLLDDPTNCMRFAAMSGKLEIIEWLHKHGCELDSLTMTWAVEAGHLEVVEWLKENGCPMESLMIEAAIVGDQLQMVKYLLENGCPRDKQAECRWVEYYGKQEQKIGEWLMNH